MEFTTHFELQSQTTRLLETISYRNRLDHRRDSHPLWCPVPRNLDPKENVITASSNYNSDRPRRPDLKFELFPLHSPLLGESWLVSFPPLIDMLKFSGYSYLIWGNVKKYLFRPHPTELNASKLDKLINRFREIIIITHLDFMRLTIHFRLPLERGMPISLDSQKVKDFYLITLKQACSPEYQRAQYAFKDSMIHRILQFTLLIAIRCVLHRCESQEIHCWKF